MKNKIIGVVIAVVVVAIAVLGINQFMPKTSEGTKELTIVIRDDMSGKELLKKTLHTDATTMYEFLVEKEELKVVLDNSSYGNFIVSMMGVDQGDIASGPWWLYESTNNESCSTAGMCPGIDTLPINDGDEFLFKLTNVFE